MAFMVPVMKNEFNIYKTDRNRRISECSNSSSACRSRKVSESSRSEGPSLSTSPANDFCMGSPSQRNYSMNRNTSRGFSRNSSRTSQNSLMSPTKTSVGCSPPKPSSSSSQGSLNKFHNRLVDKLKKTLRRDSSREESRS
uniref:Putative rna-binding protein with serine-rich domain 1 n=1 Tax=Phlebotomus kandelakii TaxID=1109342 RepID=A0A6B2EF50_9DIPT